MLVHSKVTPSTPSTQYPLCISQFHLCLPPPPPWQLRGILFNFSVPGVEHLYTLGQPPRFDTRSFNTVKLYAAFIHNKDGGVCDDIVEIIGKSVKD